MQSNIQNYNYINNQPKSQDPTSSSLDNLIKQFIQQHSPQNYQDFTNQLVLIGIGQILQNPGLIDNKKTLNQYLHTQSKQSSVMLRQNFKKTQGTQILSPDRQNNQNQFKNYENIQKSAGQEENSEKILNELQTLKLRMDQFNHNIDNQIVQPNSNNKDQYYQQQSFQPQTAQFLSNDEDIQQQKSNDYSNQQIFNNQQIGRNPYHKQLNQNMFQSDIQPQTQNTHPNPFQQQQVGPDQANISPENLRQQGYQNQVKRNQQTSPNFYPDQNVQSIQNNQKRQNINSSSNRITSEQHENQQSKPNYRRYRSPYPETKRKTVDGLTPKITESPKPTLQYYNKIARKNKSPQDNRLLDDSQMKHVLSDPYLNKDPWNQNFAYQVNQNDQDYQKQSINNNYRYRSPPQNQQRQNQYQPQSNYQRQNIQNVYSSPQNNYQQQQQYRSLQKKPQQQIQQNTNVAFQIPKQDFYRSSTSNESDRLQKSKEQLRERRQKQVNYNPSLNKYEQTYNKRKTLPKSLQKVESKIKDQVRSHKERYRQLKEEQQNYPHQEIEPEDIKQLAESERKQQELREKIQQQQQKELQLQEQLYIEQQKHIENQNYQNQLRLQQQQEELEQEQQQNNINNQEQDNEQEQFEDSPDINNNNENTNNIQYQDNNQQQQLQNSSHRTGDLQHIADQFLSSPIQQYLKGYKDTEENQQSLQQQQLYQQQQQQQFYNQEQQQQQFQQNQQNVSDFEPKHSTVIQSYDRFNQNPQNQPQIYNDLGYQQQQQMGAFQNYPFNNQQSYQQQQLLQQQLLTSNPQMMSQNMNSFSWAGEYNTDNKDKSNYLSLMKQHTKKHSNNTSPQKSSCIEGYTPPKQEIQQFFQNQYYDEKQIQQNQNDQF